MYFDGEHEIGTVSGTLYHIAGNNRSNDGEDLCVCRLCVCVFLQLILFSDAFCTTYQKGAIQCHPVGIMAPFSIVLFCFFAVLCCRVTPCVTVATTRRGRIVASVLIWLIATPHLRLTCRQSPQASPNSSANLSPV